MQQLRFLSPGDIERQDAPAPTMRSDDDDVLVRPLAVARWDVDAATPQGEFPASGPIPLGHESIGEVIDAGPTSGPPTTEVILR